MNPEDGVQPLILEGSPLIHDLLLALVFLSMIVTPALVAMRPESEHPEL